VGDFEAGIDGFIFGAVGGLEGGVGGEGVYECAVFGDVG